MLNSSRLSKFFKVASLKKLFSFEGLGLFFKKYEPFFIRLAYITRKKKVFQTYGNKQNRKTIGKFNSIILKNNIYYMLFVPGRNGVNFFYFKNKKELDKLAFNAMKNKMMSLLTSGAV